MLKSVEIKNEINDLLNTMEVLNKEGKVEEAHAKLSELGELKNKLAVEEALEANKSDIVDVKLEEVNNVIEVKNEVKSNINPERVFNKLVAGKSVSDAELEAYRNAVGSTGQVEIEGARGGYLVPVQQFNSIIELKRAYVSLKPFTNVVSSTSYTGTVPVQKSLPAALTAFDELSDIAEGTVTFDQVKYTLKDYGLIIPISRSLLADETTGLVGYIGRYFAKASVLTENSLIIGELKKLTPTTYTDYKDLRKTLNVDLDPAMNPAAILITNQTGFNMLDEAEDGQKRPLLNTNLSDPTPTTFKGAPIIVLPDAQLTGSTAKKVPFFIGDLASFATFFNRQELEVMTSTEAAFKQNAVLLRAIERFDVKTVDAAAMKYLEFTITP